MYGTPLLPCTVVTLSRQGAWVHVYTESELDARFMVAPGAALEFWADDDGLVWSRCPGRSDEPYCLGRLD